MFSEKKSRFLNSRKPTATIFSIAVITGAVGLAIADIIPGGISGFFGFFIGFLAGYLIFSMLPSLSRLPYREDSGHLPKSAGE